MSTSQSLRLQVILGAVDQLTRPLQGMMQGSHKLSGAVKEARDRLRDLEAQQKRGAVSLRPVCQQIAELRAVSETHGKHALRHGVQRAGMSNFFLF